uniref:Retrovirus-related Pol polyprotein from transposon TNT 1-94 n=1 Tax=Cajanus cajan TaxID=3821 RepID=A0A151RZE5_CAJCA|nr:Retrovirus-related Pol polyprotein from transposon TNT 1-94 [Cajanus cajan]
MSKCNLVVPNNKTFSVCKACCYGKIHRLSFSSSTTTFTAPLQMIYSDLWGPSPIPSSNGSMYYMNFIDAYSKYTWIYLLQHKSQALTCFIHFKNMIENQLDHKIKCIQTDGGKEYIAFTKFLQEHGILHHISCPYIHEQNGNAERKHTHITKMGLSILAHASMPLKYWGEAFNTVVHIINRLPTPTLAFSTLIEKLFSKSPSYNDLKVFGSTCYPFLRPYNKNKFDFKTSECVFLGYNSSYKGYMCLSSTGRIYISRHVIFNEFVFPFASNLDFVKSSTLIAPSLSHDSLPYISLIAENNPAHIVTQNPEPPTSISSNDLTTNEQNLPHT